MASHSSLTQFLNRHLAIQGVLHEDDEQCPPWWEIDSTVEIKQETYYQYLDMLPPRYMHGDLFVYGEGAGAFSIFWSQAGRFYVRHLSLADTEVFCQLARVPLHI